ncbi:unnamed protein product [Amoebophrya sp. A25]|nr:unnamed protein product [Amoebophrya sp. A25]|eukprot:GSA25T00018999001.1
MCSFGLLNSLAETKSWPVNNQMKKWMLLPRQPEEKQRGDRLHRRNTGPLNSSSKNCLSKTARKGGLNLPINFLTKNPLSSRKG